MESIAPARTARRGVWFALAAVLVAAVATPVAESADAPRAAAPVTVTFGSADHPADGVAIDKLTTDAKFLADEDDAAKADQLPADLVGLMFTRRPVVHRGGPTLTVAIDAPAGGTVYLIIPDGKTAASARTGATKAGWTKVDRAHVTGSHHGGCLVYKQTFAAAAHADLRGSGGADVVVVAASLALANPPAGTAAGTAPTGAATPGTGATDPAADRGVFRPLPVPDPVRTIAASEDGRLLLMAHEQADKVTVWDVAAGKVVRTLACPSPRAMLCRGGKAYVGSYGHGKILVFDLATGAQTDELLTGLTDMFYLSAPAGAAFHGRLVATCDDPDGHGNAAVLIDAARDTYEVHKSGGIASVTADGKFLIRVGIIGGCWLFDTWSIDGDKPGDAGKVAPNLWWIYAAGPGGWMFDDTAVMTPDGADKVRGDLRELLVPDATRPAVYQLASGIVTAYRTDATLDPLGQAPVRYTAVAGQRGRARPAEDVRGMVNPDRRRREHIFDAPVAATVDGTLHIFFCNADAPVVEAATFAPFVGDAAPTPAVAANSAGVGVGPDEAGPITVPVGKPFSHRVAVPPGAKATLVTGPTGMALSADHVLTWTPSAGDAGTTQAVKLRIDPATGQPAFVRLTLDVPPPPAPPPSATIAAGTTPAGQARGRSPRRSDSDRPLTPEQAIAAAAAADPRAITLPYDHMAREVFYSFAPSYDGHHLLVLHGNQLQVTDGSGAEVAQTLTLPRRYGRIAERDAYYVATSATTLDLIDKQTMAVTKSIRLHTTETYDLTLHPTLRMAYVALHDEALGSDSSARSRRVALVNETTGATTVIPGVFGQWVVADPLGRQLYVGLHEVYQKGYRLNFDFDFEDPVMPVYGSIDVLGVLPLRNGIPQRGKAIADPGVNGSGIRVAGDGKAVSYVSGGGRPGGSYAIPALDPNNLAEALTVYSAKDQGFIPAPRDLCYHPTLPLVAMAIGDKVLVFNRDTGDRLDGKLGPMPKLDDVDRVFFSPDGKGVVIDPVVDVHTNPTGPPTRGRRLFAVPLNLTAAEQAAVARPLPPRPPSVPSLQGGKPAAPVPPKDDDAAPGSRA
jgi:hypothetical protein